MTNPTEDPTHKAEDAQQTPAKPGGFSDHLTAEEIHAEAFPSEAEAVDAVDALDATDSADSAASEAKSLTDEPAPSTETIVSSGTDDPLSDAQIQQYRKDINRLDRVILDAIKERTAISKAVGKSRMGSGGTRLVHTREVAIINQFREELGPEGPAIAVALLRMGRGRLG